MEEEGGKKVRKSISYFLGFLGAACYIVLTIYFLFFNPYTSRSSGQDTLFIMTVFMVLPAILAYVFIILSKKIIAMVFLLVLLPLSIYFLIASTTIWIFYLLAWFILLLSIIIRPKKEI